MAHGLEGGRLIHRGAETDLIHKESKGRTSESLIDTQRRLASEMVQHSRIVSVLKGEESVPFIAHNKDSEKQLSMAKTMLHNTPFLTKFMPPQLDAEEQAALIVSLSVIIQEGNEQMN